MRPLGPIAAVIFCGVITLVAQTKPQEKEKPQGRKATLRLAWWKTPDVAPELALLQEKDQVRFYPDTMGLTVKTSYVGPPVAIIAKKTVTTEKDKQGNPVVTWTPYASVPVPNEGADLGVIMFPDNSGLAAQTQVFDFSEQSFPYGSILIVNYTNARIDAAIGDKLVQISPRGRGRYPGQFTKRQPARFSLAVTEPGAEPRLITSTTMIFYPNTRLMYFVIERSGARLEERYHNSVIMENKVDAPAPLPPPVNVTPPAASMKGKPKAGEAASR
ncbi:MAG: hypothetical protein ACKO4N_08280 [Verrucomicrobiota bacterium]